MSTLSMQIALMYSRKHICILKFKTLVLVPKPCEEQRHNTHYNFYVIRFCQFCPSDKWHNYCSSCWFWELQRSLHGPASFTRHSPWERPHSKARTHSALKPAPAPYYLVSEATEIRWRVLAESAAVERKTFLLRSRRMLWKWVQLMRINISPSEGSMGCRGSPPSRFSGPTKTSQKIIRVRTLCCPPLAGAFICTGRGRRGESGVLFQNFQNLRRNFIRVLHLNPEDYLMSYIILIPVSQLIASWFFLRR